MPKPSHHSHGLTLTPTGAAELSPAHKKFNKLLGDLEYHRGRIAARTLVLEQALSEYAQHLAPAEIEEHLARQKLLLKLGEFWRERSLLKQGQDTQLRDFILAESELLRPPTGTPEEEPLVDLITELMTDLRKALAPVDPEMKTMRDFATTLFDQDLAAEMDQTRFNDAMSSAEIIEEYKRQEEAMRASRTQGCFEEKQSRREQKAAAKKAERDEARELTLGNLYKQLAKALHPDMERDASRLTEKHGLMQQVTEAYRNKDLFTLLRLELEHLRKDGENAAGLTQEKLKLYVAMLNQQIAMLKDECANLAYEPRFACITDAVLDSHPRPPAWAALARLSRLRTSELVGGHEILCDKPAVARKHLRSMISSFEADRKFREKYGEPAFP